MSEISRFENQDGVIKLGTAVLTDEEGKLDVPRLHVFAQKIVEVRAVTGVANLIVVTSAAVARGRERYDRKHGEGSSQGVDEQVLAGLGSAGVNVAWEEAFEQQELDGEKIVLAGQALVTHDELDSAKEGRNLIVSLDKNGEEGVISVINANDLLSPDEVRRDNDYTAAHAAWRKGASFLLYITESGGFKINGTIEREISASDEETLLEHCIEEAGESNGGSGGMKSKIENSALAIRNGVEIVHIGSPDDSFVDMLADDPSNRPGTRVTP